MSPSDLRRQARRYAETASTLDELSRERMLSEAWSLAHIDGRTDTARSAWTKPTIGENGIEAKREVLVKIRRDLAAGGKPVPNHDGGCVG